MLSERKYGLNMSLLATRVLPVLIPQVGWSSMSRSTKRYKQRWI
jgi:hypothetical protein